MVKSDHRPQAPRQKERWRRQLTRIAPESRALAGTRIALWIRDLQRRRHIVGSIVLGGAIIIPFFLLGIALTGGRIAGLLGMACAAGWVIIVVANAAALHKRSGRVPRSDF
jgi:hypothetical protein